MTDRNFKSGMGTDVDAIRMILVVLPIALAFASYDHHNLALLVAAIMAAGVFGWWFTRARYLGLIDGPRKEIEELEKIR